MPKFGYFVEIPEPARELVAELCQDVAALRRLWDHYRVLFFNEAAREIIHDTAPGAFLLFDASLTDAIVLAVCRLADPAGMGNFRNLSFDRLAGSISSDNDLASLVAEFKAAAAPVVTVRNKLVGHSDLLARLQAGSAPAGLSGVEIERVVTAGEAVLKHVVESHADCEIRFEVHEHGGSDALLFWLDLGLRADRAGFEPSRKPE